MYFRYDIKQGLIRTRFLWIAVVLFAIYECVSFGIESKVLYESGKLDRNIYITDLLVYLWKGDKPIALYNPGEFHFPFLWISSQLLLSFIIGMYPFSEIYQGHGAYVLIKGGNRFKWISSKFVLILIQCFLFYLLYLLTAVIISIVNGYRIEFIIHPSTTEFLVTSSASIYGWHLILLLILPFITSLALSSLQLLILTTTNSAISVIGILSLCVASTYYDSIMAFPNCGALQRNACFSMGNIPSSYSFLILLMLIVASYLITVFVFTNLDVIKKGKTI